MNRRLIQAGLAAGTVSLAAAALAVPRSSAQPSAPDAAAVAAQVQSFYDRTKSLSARFVQRYRSRVYQSTHVARGRVRFLRPGRMRFDYDEPNGKVIVSDGDRLLVYEPGDGGGRGQYFERALEQAQLPQVLSLLAGRGRLERDFTFRLPEAARHGDPRGHVLELRPRRPSPHYERIFFDVDASEDRRGLIHRVMIIDPSGNRNRFEFQEQDTQTHLPESVFSWRPPAGSRRARL